MQWTEKADAIRRLGAERPAASAEGLLAEAPGDQMVEGIGAELARHHEALNAPASSQKSMGWLPVISITTTLAVRGDCGGGGQEGRHGHQHQHPLVDAFARPGARASGPGPRRW